MKLIIPSPRIKTIQRYVLILSFLFLGISFSFTEPLSPIPKNLKVFFQKEQRIRVPGLKRFLVTKPEYLKIAREGDTLILAGGWLGETTLIVWTDTGRHSCRIESAFPPKAFSDINKTEEQKLAKKAGAYIDFEYQYIVQSKGKDRNNLVSLDPIENIDLLIYLPLDYKYKNMSINTGITWDSENSKFDYSSLSAAIKDITWPRSQKYSILLGNIPGFNEKTLSTRNLLGIRVTPITFSVFSYIVFMDIMAGRETDRKSALYQNTLFSNSRIPSITKIHGGKKSTFVGLKFKTSSPEPVLGFKTSSQLTLLHDDQKETNSGMSSVLSVSLNKPSCNIGGSVSYSGDSPIFNYNLQLYKTLGKLYAGFSRNVFGLQSESEENNTLASENNVFSLNYLPKIPYIQRPQVSLSYSINRNESLKQKTKKFGAYGFGTNLSFRGDVFNIPLNLQYRDSDFSKTDNPYKSHSWLFNTSKTFSIFYKPLRLNAGYTNTFTERKKNQALSTELDSYQLGMTYQLFPWASYSLQYRHHQYNREEQESSSSTVSHNISLSKSFFKSLMRGNLRYGYSKSESDDIFSSFTSNTINQTVGVGVSSSPSPHFQIKLDYFVLFQDSSESERDQVSTRFETSVRSRFHTLFGWKPKTEFDVLVFFDENGNGIFDPIDDRPLPDAEVLINGKPVGKTDEEGKLEGIKKRAFQKEVKISQKSIPPKYYFSTGNSYTFKKLKSSKEKCIFGISIYTEISGTIFNDINENGVYDETDTPIPGVLVELSKDYQTSTDDYGRYSFRMPKLGDYEIKISPLTIPEGFYSADRIKRNGSIQKGDIVWENFAFRAERNVEGTVLVKNSGKLRTFPCKGVVIECLGKKYTTNSRGQFKIRRLPKGFHEITINLDTIPYKVSQTSHYTISVHFGNLPETEKRTIILDQE